MESDKVNYTKLEVHDTKSVDDDHVNGKLTVIWRDWDDIVKFDPKMVYISSVFPGEKKGPHLHTKRDSFFVCIKGKAIFIVKEPNGNYVEIESSEENPVMVHVPKNYESAHINISHETSTILALASIAWRPNDNEMKNTSFDDYDWKKWEKR